MSCAQLVVGFYLATGLGPWSSARLAGLGDTKMESLMEAHVESVHWAHSVQPIAAAAVCDAQLKVMGMSWAWRHASRAPLEVRNGNLVSSTAFARWASSRIPWIKHPQVPFRLAWHVMRSSLVAPPCTWAHHNVSVYVLQGATGIE